MRTLPLTDTRSQTGVVQNGGFRTGLAWRSQANSDAMPSSILSPRSTPRGPARPPTCRPDTAKDCSSSLCACSGPIWLTRLMVCYCDGPNELLSRKVRVEARPAISAGSAVLSCGDRGSPTAWPRHRCRDGGAARELGVLPRRQRHVLLAVEFDELPAPPSAPAC